MSPKNEDKDPIVRGDAAWPRVIAFGGDVDAVSQSGIAVAFGRRSCARVESSTGQAVAFGGGVAKAQTAVTMLSSGGSALGDLVAVALNHAGKAVGGDLAFADNLDSQASSRRLAIATGTRGIADGLVSISLGREGRVVAREGGIIAIAFYDQHPGRWETAHGCDPCWHDGDEYLSDIKVAKVGENGVRAGFVYQLDKQGGFAEVGPSAISPSDDSL